MNERMNEFIHLPKITQSVEQERHGVKELSIRSRLFPESSDSRLRF